MSVKPDEEGASTATSYPSIPCCCRASDIVVVAWLLATIEAGILGAVLCVYFAHSQLIPSVEFLTVAFIVFCLVGLIIVSLFYCLKEPRSTWVPVHQLFTGLHATALFAIFFYMIYGMADLAAYEANFEEKLLARSVNGFVYRPRRPATDAMLWLFFIAITIATALALIFDIWQGLVVHLLRKASKAEEPPSSIENTVDTPSVQPA